MKYKQWNCAGYHSAAADAMVEAGIPRLAAMVLCALMGGYRFGRGR